ncbi:MAG: B12-binding domain-containing radical SAM protein [Candidatus Aureabacteria bacterium]|nr:B12-binding domain-containing radical SAM protein [Candidatus Auribacterota bacterium]
MKLLLVYPQFPKNTYWSFSYSLPIIAKKASMPPLGLITVAAMIPSQHEIRLIDMNIGPLEEKDMLWADMVMTSSMIVQKESLQEVIDMANRLRIPVACGGPYPTQYYGEIHGADYLLLGEAESGVLDSFLRDVEKGEVKRVYARPVIRSKAVEKKIDEEELASLYAFSGENAEIISGMPRPSMVSSPVPRFDLLKMDEYASMAVQFSRGCPFFCDFCNEATLFGHEARVKSAGKIMEEIRQIFSLGYRGPVFVVDDNFISNVRAVKRALLELRLFQESNNYPFTFYTEASINLARDEELMAMMRDARFDMVFVGIETPDKNVLKSMNKYQNVRTNLLEDVRKIQSYGMEVTAGFIIGNDKDPENITDQIFDFCREAGIPKVMAGLLSAVKGSELYARLREEGRLLEDTDGNNTHSLDLNFIPLPGKDKNKIIEDYKNLLIRLYDTSGRNFFERCSVLLDHWNQGPKAVGRVKWKDIKILLRSMNKQTFTRYGWTYWKWLFHSIVFHAEQFPEAVALCVMGHHFIEITQSAHKAYRLYTYCQEKLDYFTEKMAFFWKTRRDIGEEWVERLIEDKKNFLLNAKNKIHALPSEYHPKLMETYKNIHVYLELTRHFLEKVLHFRQRLNFSIKSGLSLGEERVQKIFREKNEFLIRMKERIEALPREYRNKLIRLHEEYTLYLDSLFPDFEGTY